MFAEDVNVRFNLFKSLVSNASTSFDLPESIDIVKRKTFGSRPISNEEMEALKMAISDGRLITKMEKSRTRIRGIDPKNSKWDTEKYFEAAHTFSDSVDELSNEVLKELREKIEQLKGTLKQTTGMKDTEIKQLKEKINSFEKFQKKVKKKNKKKK